MSNEIAAARCAPGTPFGLGCFVLFAILSAQTLCAQTNAPRPSFPSNRYLIVVDTSRTMQRRADGVLKAVESLISSGMDGQLRRGDSVAIWTYNADLYAGRFPLQLWTPDNQKTVALRILSFLKEQTYEKQHNLPKALVSIDKVIKSSDFLTVILISDGEQGVQGTPFDEEINKLYKLWAQEQQKARMPIVTVMRATKGKLTHFSVTSTPWPVEMPPLPEGLLVAAPAQTNALPETKTPPAAAAKKLGPTMAPPLILSGKKPASQAPKPSSPIAPLTNSSVEGAKSEPPIQTTLVPTQPPVQIPAAETPKPQIETPVSNPPSAPPVASPSPSVSVIQPKPADAKPPEGVPSNAASPLSPPPAQRPVQAPIIPSQQPPVVAAPATPTTTAPEPQPVLARTEVTPSNPGPATDRPSPNPTSEIQNAVVVPTQPISSRTFILVAGSIFGLIALSLVIMTRRRGRTPPPSSLITRSFDRERKP